MSERNHPDDERHGVAAGGGPAAAGAVPSWLVGVRGVLTLEGFAHPERWRAGLTIASVLLVLLVFAEHLHRTATFVLVWTRVSMPTIESTAGFAHFVRLGHHEWSAHDGTSQAVVLEDGVELPAGNDVAHADIREQGGGRSSFWHDGLYFSTSDNSDPRTNGRTYELRGPARVDHQLTDGLRTVCILLLAWACVAWTGFAAGSENERARARAWIGLLAGLFVFALLVRVGWWLEILADPTRYTTGVRVMGLPFSDARDWDVTGELLLAGRGLVPAWDARRPGYAVFLALLYFWCTPSTTAAIVANLVLGALAAPLVCMVGRRVGNGAVGVLGALTVAVQPELVDLSNTVMTEPLGLALGVGSVLLVVRGLSSGRAGPTFWGGVVFGLSNLVRPATLLAAPVWVVLLPLVLWRRVDRPWRRAALLACALAAGALVSVGPWLVRQQVKYGFWSISDNTSVTLFAASTPKYGQWTGAVYDEATRDGISPTIGDRYRYFSRRAGENIAANPGWYLSESARWTGVSLRHLMGLPGVANGLAIHVALVGAGLMVLLRGRSAGPVIAAGLVAVGGAWLTHRYPSAAAVTFTSLAVAGGLAARAPGVLVVASTGLMTSVAVGLLGGSVYDRMNTLTVWIPAVLGPCGAWMAVSAAGRVSLLRAATSRSAKAPVAGAPRRGAVLAASAVALVIGVPAATVTYRNFFARPTERLAARHLSSAERAAVTARLAAAGLLDASIPDDALEYRQGTIARVAYPLPGAVDFSGHWSAHLRERPYARTLFRHGIEAGCTGMIGGDLPDRMRSGEVISVSWPDPATSGPGEPPVREVLALVPCRADGTPDWAALLPTTPEHRADVHRRLGAVQATGTGD